MGTTKWRACKVAYLSKNARSVLPRRMLTDTCRQSKAVLFERRTAFVQKAECVHVVLSNSNHNAFKSYRLNRKNILLIFLTIYLINSITIKFYLLIINLINHKWSQLLKGGGSFDCFYSISGQRIFISEVYVKKYFFNMKWIKINRFYMKLILNMISGEIRSWTSVQFLTVRLIS